MSTFAGTNSGLVSINTLLQETFAIDQVDPNAPGPLRSLAERIGRDLVSNAQVLTRHGAFQRESWTNKAAIALRVLTVRPFSRLREIAEACRCNYDDAITLVAAIHRNRDAARYLVRFGADAPYRRSTIQPIAESGAVKAFLEGTYRYPFTVGIYPAVSCMLSCSFCARARGEQYKREAIVPGNELYEHG